MAHVLAQADPTAPALDLAQYGPLGIVLAITLAAIWVLYRQQVKAHEREQQRADKYEQLYLAELAKNQKVNRRRSDD